MSGYLNKDYYHKNQHATRVSTLVIYVYHIHQLKIAYNHLHIISCFCLINILLRVFHNDFNLFTIKCDRRMIFFFFFKIKGNYVDITIVVIKKKYLYVKYFLS